MKIKNHKAFLRLKLHLVKKNWKCKKWEGLLKIIHNQLNSMVKGNFLKGWVPLFRMIGDPPTNSYVSYLAGTDRLVGYDRLTWSIKQADPILNSFAGSQIVLLINPLLLQDQGMLMIPWRTCWHCRCGVRHIFFCSRSWRCGSFFIFLHLWKHGK